MMTLSEIQHFLYHDLNISSPITRRSLLIDEMSSLTHQKINCFTCTGTCCTFSANSMQISPLETFEMLLSLDLSKTNISELQINLQKNIQNYRLDHEIFLGKKKNSLLRKTYTCPFFLAGSKGCTIKKQFKPYGCLAFNPSIENDNGQQCISNIPLLKARENAELNNEKMANQFLQNELQLSWEKLEIPKAILQLLEKLRIL